MSSATYGSNDRSSIVPGRSSILQRPLQIVIMTGDLLSVLFSYLLAGFLYHHFVGASFEEYVPIGAGLIVGTVFVTIACFQGVYDSHHLFDGIWLARKTVLIWVLSLAILAVAAFLLKSAANLSRGTVLLFAFTGLCSLAAHRVIWRIGMSSSFAKYHLINRRVALISFSAPDLASNRFKDLRKTGFHIARTFVLDMTTRDRTARERDLLNIIRESRAARVDEFLIAIDCNELSMLPLLCQALRQVPLPIRLLPDIPIADLVSRTLIPAGTTVAIEIQRTPLSMLERAQKRCLDVGLASIALLVIAPLLIATAILVKLDSPGSVIFRQTRRGFNGRPFDIWKFRSMTTSENGDCILQARREDTRVTRVGKLLRRSSIDELPQLWNVLRGEMSLVGPRPHALAHDNYYDQMISNYAYRHHMKPGLTGWAQINGLRGETPTIDLMEKRVEYDVWYVSNWSIWLDIRILIRTAMVFIHHDAY
jgi:putative colanic acid biosysnthesis UDP-glucose lipid carrier transferase